MKQPLVSVVIPTYGRSAELLSRAVNSALQQDYEPLEVLVVDDNPLQNQYSEGIRQYYQGMERVHYYKTFGNGGACAARNWGIANAQGEIIGFLDDDDYWLPGKVSCSVPLFSDEIALVGTKGWREREGEERRTVYSNANWMAHPTFESMLRVDSIGSTINGMATRRALVEVGGFKIGLPARQDYELWLRLLKRYQAVQVEHFGFVHTLHSGEQITGNPRKAYQGFLAVYQEFQREYRRDRKARFRLMWNFKECALRMNRRGLALWYYLRMLLISPSDTLALARARTGKEGTE
ncbi:MAG: glycosyltransferase family A protein [Eubacteriales bacterium]|nr:glycosyltransferase family A protein [Eubacteriales bacterium]